MLVIDATSRKETLESELTRLAAAQTLRNPELLKKKPDKFDEGAQFWKPSWKNIAG